MLCAVECFISVINLLYIILFGILKPESLVIRLAILVSYKIRVKADNLTGNQVYH